jgi:hypothetical protein
MKHGIWGANRATARQLVAGLARFGAPGHQLVELHDVKREAASARHRLTLNRCLGTAGGRGSSTSRLLRDIATNPNPPDCSFAAAG